MYMVYADSPINYAIYPDNDMSKKYNCINCSLTLDQVLSLHFVEYSINVECYKHSCIGLILIIPLQYNY